jgi:hypothetical protein
VNIPGFTAESALCRSTGAYAAIREHAPLGRDAVIPALGIRYCKNTRPGWVIEYTLCGDCADFVVRCYKGTCWWVRVSDWQHECWDTPVYG